MYVTQKNTEERDAVGLPCAEYCATLSGDKDKCLLLHTGSQRQIHVKNTGKVSLANQLNSIGITYRSMGELLLTGAKMCSKTN